VAVSTVKHIQTIAEVDILSVICTNKWYTVKTRFFIDHLWGVLTAVIVKLPQRFFSAPLAEF